MKTWLYIAALIFFQIQLVSCKDDTLVDIPTNSGTSISLVVNIPVDNGTTRGLVYGPDEAANSVEESQINDLYILAFNENGTCIGNFNHQKTNTGAFIVIVDKEEAINTTLNIMVLANLKDQENGTALVGTIDNAVGKSKTEILNSLKYGFSETPWNISERPLPMWGETSVTTQKGQIVSSEVRLYRAVSKINVTVAKGKGVTENGIDVFKLKSVRVYYARTSGLAGSLHSPVENEEGGANTIIQTSMPADVAYMPRYKDGATNGIVFNAAEGSDYAIENQIYVPESYQQGEEPMCLVVGGYYKGSATETYYRVDFKKGNTGEEFYDAIRNHIYNFDITGVKRPGTDEPDKALDHVVVGMEVTITAWTTEYMRGIGGQYTLEVSSGGFIFTSAQTTSELTVTTTHNEGWTIASKSGTWFTAEKTDTGINITANENTGGERGGKIIVQSGNIQKTITLTQRGKGTANCYIVSDDGNHITQELIVTVKGNGEAGLIADGVQLVEKDPYIAIEKIGDVKVIWETSDGLITIKEGTDGKASLNEESGTIQYTVDLTKENGNIQTSNTLNNQSYRGGNALIGAFGKNIDGTVNYQDLLWTWHIWVCPDMDTNGNGIVSDDELKSKDETWATGYTFMDRNMGALSNKPGLPSLGLLYQWGRKDPFIGAGEVSDVQTDNRMYTHLPLQEQGYYWRVSGGNMSIAETVKAPTTLIKGKITGTDYSSLWGTASGLSGEANAGNKTIYDPCPYGYRVPNVAAIIFEGKPHLTMNTKSSTSEKANWYSNNEFWPYTPDGTDFGNGWPKYKKVSEMNSYGFWLRYDQNDTEPSVVPYSKDNTTNNQTISNDKPMTWLPLSGVYDGSMTLANVDDQNSLQTNSIMWTNSSVTTSTETRPAGLFLHGVQAGSSSDGNHFHQLNQQGGNLYAKPQQAGALRCVRDVKVDMAEENAIKITPSEITLEAEADDVKTGELTSLFGSWEVIDPGASWFVMTPDEGLAGSKQTLTFKSTQLNAGGERSAVIKIRFNDGKGSVKTITVTQKGLNLTNHQVTSEITLGYQRNSSASGNIVAIDDNWRITSGQVDWLSITPMQSASISQGGTSTVTYIANTENPSNSARSTTLTVSFGDGDTREITVTQEGKSYTLNVSPTRIPTFARYPNGAPKTFKIESDTEWKITTNKDWIHVDPTEGNGDCTVSVTCDDNNGRNWRYGTITIKSADGSITKSVSISQRGN